MGMSKLSDGSATWTAERLVAHPAFDRAIREQARLLLQAYDADPKLSSVFGTQQRWLMAQAALGIYFRALTAGQAGDITAARLFDLVTRHDIASRNTADAFLKEMLKYGHARQGIDSVDRRRRPVQPTENAVDAINGWVGIHLATLDKLDRGGRLEKFLATPGALFDLQPRIADGLMSSNSVRRPERTFSLFTWLDNGGVAMDRLMAGVAEGEPGAERLATQVLSVADMAQWLRLSRTHLKRKLAQAEALGSLGWQGKRGDSAMWVSAAFCREYANAQAEKLAIIDRAFTACLRRDGIETPTATAADERPPPRSLAN